jgi:oxygen-independent coproporphyrinogen III oxidase
MGGGFRLPPFFFGGQVPLSLYVHVPFCSSKCLYCDFTSGYRPDAEATDRYTAALCRELEIVSSEHPDKTSLATIYFGGGTPSLLPLPELEKVVDAVRKNYTFPSPVETTLEANPDDVTKEKAAAWHQMGFDRVSLGVQSMEDGVLKFLSRRNTASQNRKAVEVLRTSGLKNISIDWICGIRGENNGINIGQMLDLKPEHFSVYQLTVEEKTLLHRKTKTGEYEPLTDEQMLRSFWEIAGVLEQKGYARYEISNFALPGFESRHNRNYWDYGEYVGAGLGASGFLRGGPGVFGKRWTNHATFREYYDSLEKGELPAGFTENVGRDMAYREFVMLGLRKSDGIRYRDFYSVFGRDFFSVFDEKKIHAHTETVLVDEKGLRLTKRGVDVSNRVIRDIWDAVIERNLK